MGSFKILVALLEHRDRKMSRMEGRGAPRIFAVHCPLEGLAGCCTTVPVPDSDAAGQHALNGSPVESCEDGWRETCSFQPAEKVCAFLESVVVLVVQVRSSLMCTPRNLVLLILSTVELSMVSEGVVTLVSPEVHHILLCLTHIKGQFVCTTPFSQLCHFLSVLRFIIVSNETYH